MLILLLAACAARFERTGLLEAEGGAARLVDADGARWRLVADEARVPLRHLDGCVLTVQGPRQGRRVFVREWRVRDAGDGSEPFVGRLRRYGSHWVIDDHNSGVSVSLDPTALGGLESWEGRLVLVVGYVVGTHEVRVVSWRPLDGE